MVTFQKERQEPSRPLSTLIRSSLDVDRRLLTASEDVRALCQLFTRCRIDVADDPTVELEGFPFVTAFNSDRFATIQVIHHEVEHFPLLGRDLERRIAISIIEICTFCFFNKRFKIVKIKFG